jgi:hypothetical protein
VQLPQKRQPRRRLTVEQHEDDREIVLFQAAVECLVVLHRLPRADALFAHQQDEGRRLGDLAGKLGEPQAPARRLFGAKNILASGSLRRSAASRLCMSPKSCEL